ncbi:hypothetical protein, partial [Candidatus Binatus sp.]|uniref:hypothetical protein n=1 Tax=Candidatus Binatus sp. TaxID=2811406 RepID=UPI003CC60B10
LNAAAAQAVAQSHSLDDMQVPLDQFGARLEEHEFARIASWPLEQRRDLIAELHSMRRLEVLTSDLNRWLPEIPGSSSPPR